MFLAGKTSRVAKFGLGQQVRFEDRHNENAMDAIFFSEKSGEMTLCLRRGSKEKDHVSVSGKTEDGSVVQCSATPSFG